MLGYRRHFLTTPRTFRILKILKFKQVFQRPKGARFGLFPFRSPLLREYSPQISKFCGAFFLFLRLLRCFTSAGMLSDIRQSASIYHRSGFPHSEIPGSKVATHLPEAYRSYATSFIAFLTHEASTTRPW